MENNIYRKLQKRVNEILHPKGIPLEFGCETKQGVVISVRKYKGWDFITYDGDTGLKGGVYNSDKILGKPTTLQDLLRCIHIRKTFELTIDLQGYFASYIGQDTYEVVHETMERTHFPQHNNLTKIDMEKDIKDQDEEVLQGIYKLIS